MGGWSPEEGGKGVPRFQVGCSLPPFLWPPEGSGGTKENRPIQREPNRAVGLLRQLATSDGHHGHRRGCRDVRRHGCHGVRHGRRHAVRGA